MRHLLKSLVSAVLCLVLCLTCACCFAEDCHGAIRDSLFSVSLSVGKS